MADYSGGAISNDKGCSGSAIANNAGCSGSAVIDLRKITNDVVSAVFKTNAPDQNEECVVCLKKLNGVSWKDIKVCKKSLCQKCFKSIKLSKHPKCPNCRGELSGFHHIDQNPIRSFCKDVLNFFLLKIPAFNSDCEIIGVKEIYGYACENDCLLELIFQRVKTSMDMRRRMLVLAIMNIVNDSDELFLNIETPDEFLHFICARFSLKFMFEVGLKGFTWKKIIGYKSDYYGKFTRYIVKKKKVIISFLNRCQIDLECSDKFFGHSSKSNHTSRFWKLVFANIHVLKSKDKSSVAYQIVSRFFPVNPSQQYLEKNKKFCQRKTDENNPSGIDTICTNIDLVPFPRKVRSKSI